MYNTNNNMNPLFSLLGLTGGGQQSSGSSPQQGGSPQQGIGAGMDMNNPLMQLLAAMMGGQNAMNALNNILPQAAQYAQNNRGNQNMEQFVRNEYNNRGVDINAAMDQIQQLLNTMNANNGGYNANNGGYNTNNTKNENKNGGNYNAGNNNNTNNY